MIMFDTAFQENPNENDLQKPNFESKKIRRNQALRVLDVEGISVIVASKQTVISSLWCTTKQTWLMYFGKILILQTFDMRLVWYCFLSCVYVVSSLKKISFLIGKSIRKKKVGAQNKITMFSRLKIWWKEIAYIYIQSLTTALNII